MEATEIVTPRFDDGGRTLGRTVDKIARAVGQAADTLGVKGRLLKSAQAQATEQARIYVRENPLAALGIAVMAGYLLSRLLSSH